MYEFVVSWSFQMCEMCAYNGDFGVGNTKMYGLYSSAKSYVLKEYLLI